jgi:hypothetical protein
MRHDVIHQLRSAAPEQNPDTRARSSIWRVPSGFQSASKAGVLEEGLLRHASPLGFIGRINVQHDSCHFLSVGTFDEILRHARFIRRIGWVPV